MLRHDFHVRGGLPRFRARMDRRAPSTVAFFGASQTALRGWSNRTFTWLQERYPESRLEYHNLSQGGIGLLVANQFLRTKVLPAKPDLLFLEFSPLSLHAPPEMVLTLMEDLVRTVRTELPETDLCYVHCCDRPILEPRLAGGDSLPQLVSLETVADYYDLPSINLVEHLLRKVELSEMIYDRTHYLELLATRTRESLKHLPHYSVEGHPLIGHGDVICAELVTEALAEILEAPGRVAFPAARLTPPPEESRLEELIGTFSSDTHRIVSLGSVRGTLPDLGRFVKLRGLDLSGAAIENRELSFSTVPRLEFLKLEHCGLATPFPDVQGNRHLQHLSVRQNAMHGPMPELQENSKLELLVIAENEFSSLPPRFQLPELRVLDLSCNRFTGALPDLTGCPKLESLALEVNGFSGTFPQLGLNRLKHLSLHECRFHDYTPGALLLPTLEFLVIAYNPFSPEAIANIMRDLVTLSTDSSSHPKRVVLLGFDLTPHREEIADLQRADWNVEFGPNESPDAL